MTAAPALTRRQLLGATLALGGATAPALAGQAASAPAPSMGEHGMLLFGGHSGLYASHLPMFHRPHDVQLVMRIRFSDASTDQLVRAALAARPTLWTLVPERFELDRLAPQAPQPLRGFTADWVDGHFERGGTARESGLQLEVEQVLLHQRLSPRQRRPADLSYRRIGADARGERHGEQNNASDPQFWVKWLDARPDADHLVVVSGARAHGPDRLRWPSKPGALSVPAEAFAQRLGGKAQTLYLETGDLA